MAQLKDSIITGDLRVTGTIYGNMPLGDLSDADDLKAIEGLTGTSGLLKKTAANTWTLDTTNYTTNTGTITGVTGSDGLTGSGTSGSVTIKHAAPTQSPAKTTSAVYPITIDKYGHITAAGSAQTILTLGTGASNAAAGNHNHDSVYVNVGGDSMTGRLTMTSGKPINQILTGSGEVGRDAGAGASPRYFPAKWTFNTGLTVSDGDIFTIKTPIAGHSYGVFMSIDGTHYYPIILNTTEKFTTHYAAGTYIQVIYESSGQATSITPLAGAATANGSTVSGGAFRVLNFYNTNTTYSAMSTAEMQTGTASSNRIIQARYLKAAFLGDTSNTNPIFKTGSSKGAISVYGTDIAVNGLEQSGNILYAETGFSTPAIELKGMNASTNNGGYIDFHYNNNSNDYTSRIIESASGALTFNVTQGMRLLGQGSFHLDQTNIDASLANNNVSSTQYPAFYITDNAARVITRLESIVWSNGDIGSQWYIRNYNTSGTSIAQKGLKMVMNKSGTLTWTVDEAASFRAAIGSPENSAKQSIASADKWRKITLGSDYFNSMGEALASDYSTTGQFYVNSQLEFNTFSGMLKATEYSVNGNATLQYNSTTESLDFVF